jgi:hypothetical protein
MRVHVRMIWFLLRTRYFSPASNYLFAVTVVVLLILGFTKDLSKHMALLCLYAVGLTHAALAVLDRAAAGMSTDGGRDDRYPAFAVLPVSRLTLCTSALAAALVYAALMAAVLMPLLATALLPPQLLNTRIIHLTTPDGDPYVLLKGSMLVRSLDGLRQMMTIPTEYVLDPSMIFGTCLADGTYDMFAAWPVMILLLLLTQVVNDAVTHYSRMFGGSSGPMVSSLAKASTIVYGIAGVLILTDLLLPGRILIQLRAVFAAGRYACMAVLGAMVVIAVSRAVLFLSSAHQQDRNVLLPPPIGRTGRSGDIAAGVEGT